MLGGYLKVTLLGQVKRMENDESVRKHLRRRKQQDLIVRNKCQEGEWMITEKILMILMMTDTLSWS